jgi:predicted RNA-binding Zn ribbon-like protein
MFEKNDASGFYLIGNNLSLDFINTEAMADGKRLDLIGQVESFFRWAKVVGLLEDGQIVKLREKTTDRNLLEIAEFRKVLREMFVDLSQGNALKIAEIERINEYLKKQSGYAALERTEDGLAKRFHADYIELSQLLVPIAESAADLLVYGDLSLLKKCENPNCILYFYDTTKNHRRRWCSMAGCGNRAKAAAFYQRKKARN